MNLADAFGPENGTAYRLSQALRSVFDERPVVEGLAEVFDVEEFAEGGRCTAVLRSTPHPMLDARWGRAHGLQAHVDIGVFDVTWEGHALVVARAEWPEGFRGHVRRWFVAGETRAIAEDFANAACAYCNEPRDAVLAFRGGCWRKDNAIWKAIQASSFDDLVLAGDLAQQIHEDFTSFLAAKDEYVRYGVPWKRGVLFVGPPGNGKTHCLRATIKLLGVPCLYVQSLKAKYETDDANIEAVFDRAREVTPCCLVFEDLDAMITDENRSFFLNQLDGFTNASGMLTLATTNHPEKLDPAIVERPSRFDRKYHFALPSPNERGRYVGAWRERLDPAMHITDGQADELIAKTDGFSFAYLKELFLSSMIRWMKTKEKDAMFGILDSQLETLRTQMKTDASPTPEGKLPEKARWHYESD